MWMGERCGLGLGECGVEDTWDVSGVLVSAIVLVPSHRLISVIVVIVIFALIAKEGRIGTNRLDCNPFVYPSPSCNTRI